MKQTQIETFLQPALARLEVERKQVKKQVQYNIWETNFKKIALTVACFGLIIFLMKMIYYLLLAFFLSVTVIIGMVKLWRRIDLANNKNILLAKNFENRVKKDLFAQIFKQWNTSMTYIPFKYLSEETFNLVGDKRGYNTYYGDDYVEGKLEDGRSFCFSEITQKQITGQARNTIKVQKSLLLMVEDSVLLEEQPAPIKISSLDAAASQERKKKENNKKKKDTPPLSKKYMDNVLDSPFTNNSPCCSTYNN